MSIPFNSDHFLDTVLRASTSPLPFQSKLDEILRAISDAFQSDRCLLLRPEGIRKDGFLSRLLSQGKPLWVGDGSSFRGDELLPEERDLVRPSFVCLPLCDETSSQGVLYLAFSGKRIFSTPEIDLLILAAQAVGDLIRNSQLHAKAEEAMSEVEALHDLGKVVTSTLKLNDLLELILRTGSKIVKAKGGVLRLEDRRTGELKVQSSQGGYDQNPFDDTLSKRVLFTQAPLLLNNFDKAYPFLSVLSAPLHFK